MYFFELFIPDWVIIVAALTLVLYKWAVAKHDHFLKLGVDHDKPLPLFGSFLETFLHFDGQYMTWKRQYEKYKNKSFFGIYEQRKPILVVNDPNLIRQIFVTDADHFMNNAGLFNTKYLFKHSVPEVTNEKWIKVRLILEQCLSPKALRYMFYSRDESSKQVIDNLKKQVGSDSAHNVDIFPVFAEFFSDMMTTMTFGMRSNNLSNEHNIFLKKVLESFPKPPLYLITYFLDGNFPWIAEFFRMRLINEKFVSYFNTLVKDIIAYRQKHNIQHFDIAHILMSHTTHDLDSTISLTDDEVISLCFIVLFSGFAKCSAITTSATIELAANPEIQAKLQREIDIVSERNNGSILTYEILESMEYLDMVVHETFRKWPGIFTIDRVCTKPYKIVEKSSGHSVGLQPGDIVCMPICGLYWDRELFADPDKFDPGRFSSNKRGFIRPYTFLPFGIGPRNCYGAKFAMLLTKVALVTLFSEFDVKRTPEKIGNVLYDDSLYSPKHKINQKMILKRRKSEK